MKKILVISLSLLFAATLSARPEGKRKHMKKGNHMKKFGENMMKKRFEKVDANKDGKISKQEWDGFHADKFKEIDANNDGNIAVEEMQNHMKAKMEKFRSKRGKKGKRGNRNKKE